MTSSPIWKPSQARSVRLTRKSGETASFPVCLHAAEKPDRYRSLQLEGAALRWGENRISFVNRPGWEASYVEHLQQILRAYHELSSAEIVRRSLLWAKGVSAETFSAYLDALSEPDLTDVLPRIEVPTWVVARAAVDFGPATEIAALLPNSILTLYRPDGPDLRTGEVGRREWDKHLGALLGDAPAEGQRLEDVNRARVALSPRQLDVLKRVALGETNSEIAAALGLAEGTVKRHVSDLLHKTELKNRRQLMRFFDELETGPVARP